jgi:hypothetical protein
VTDRIRIGDSAHTGVPIKWLNERGYDAESFGCDGFGRSDRQGIMFSRDLDDTVAHPPMFALIGAELVWDGDIVTILPPA